MNGLIFIAIVTCFSAGYIFYLLECEARWNVSREVMQLKGLGNRNNDNFWR